MSLAETSLRVTALVKPLARWVSSANQSLRARREAVAREFAKARSRLTKTGRRWWFRSRSRSRWIYTRFIVPQVPFWFVPAVLATIGSIWWLDAPVMTFRGAFSSGASLGTLLGVLAGTLASIAGVAIAVVLVALQVLRATYSSVAVREILSRSSFKALLALYLIAIAAAVAALASIDSPIPNRSIALAYLAAGLFLASLLSLPGAIDEMMGMTRIGDAKLKSLAERVDLQAGQWHANMPDPIPEEDPLFLLTDIGERAVRERDRTLPRAVVLTAFRRLEHLLRRRPRGEDGDDAQDWRGLINRFLGLFLTIARASALAGDERTLQTVGRCLSAVHSITTECRFPRVSVLELKDAITSHGKLAIRGHFEDATRLAAAAMTRALIRELSTISPKGVSNLSMRETDATGPELTRLVEDTIDWHRLQGEYLHALATLCEEAVLTADWTSSESCLYALSSVPADVVQIEGLSSEQKLDVIENAWWLSTKHIVEAAKAFGKAPALSTMTLGSHTIPDDLASGAPWGRVSIERICKVFRELAALNTLPTHLLNVLGTLERGCTHHVQANDVSAEAIVLLAETIASCALTLSGAAGAGSAALDEAEKQLASALSWDRERLRLSPAAYARVSTALSMVQSRKRITPHTPAEDPRFNWPSLS